MCFLKLEVYCERDSKGDWGEGERYCQMETLEKRQISISREGRKERKEGRRQIDIVYNQGSCSCHPNPAGL